MGRAHRERDQTFSYDADGNFTEDGAFKYKWNAENRLIRVRPKGTPSSGDVRLTYVYDYLGRRVRKTVETHNGSSWAETADTKFVWYNWLMLLELDDSDDVLRKYSWGLDLAGQAGRVNSLESAGGIGGLVGVRNFGQTPARSYVYFCDGNGNVVQAINRSSDSIAARYEYDAYGNNLLDASDPNESGPFAEDNPFRFSTKYYDGENDDPATVVNEGTYYYGYRDYLPRLGRWGSEDPLGEQGQVLSRHAIGDSHAEVQFQAVHDRYTFSQNSPATYFDLLGLKCCRTWAQYWAGFKCCATRTYDPAKQCCTNYTVVNGRATTQVHPKQPWDPFDPQDMSNSTHNAWVVENRVSIWLCKRPIPGLPPGGGGLPWWLHFAHTYVCCDGPNSNCYGKQWSTKKGNRIPREMLAVSFFCEKKMVCPAVKREKCNAPIAQFTYGPLWRNCHAWAWRDVDSDMLP